MNIETARTLKQGDLVYHTTEKNSNGSPMRARVTSVKTWKRDLQRIEVRVKHGLYDYAIFNECELHLLSTNESKD